MDNHILVPWYVSKMEAHKHWIHSMILKWKYEDIQLPIYSFHIMLPIMKYKKENMYFGFIVCFKKGRYKQCIIMY